MEKIVISGKEMDKLLSDPELSKEKDYVIERLAAAHMIFDLCSKNALYCSGAAIICMLLHQMIFPGRPDTVSIIFMAPMVIVGLGAIYNVVGMLLCRKQMRECGIYFRRVVELAIIKDCLREIQDELQRRKDETADETD